MSQVRDEAKTHTNEFNGKTRRARLLAASSALAAVLALLCVGSAGAAAPSLLVKTPEDGKPGSGAGQLALPRGVTADPNLPGNVYVADQNGHRISVFTPWGEFVKAFGWGVDAGSPEEKLQACTAASSCQTGSAGGGKGQFKFPEALATSPQGDLYVAEQENHRIQKFDSEGNFLLMFGFKVNKTAEEEGRTAEENVCPAAGHPADVCQAGTAGTGPGRLDNIFYRNKLAVSPIDGTVFIGQRDQKAIEVFNPDGSFKEEIAMPKSVKALAADAEGNLHANLVEFNEIVELDETEVRALKPHGPTAEFFGPVIREVLAGKVKADLEALALDSAGNLFVTGSWKGVPGFIAGVLEFDPAGKCLNCGSEGEGGKPGFDHNDGTEAFENYSLQGLAIGSACGFTDIYVTHAKAFTGEPDRAESYFNIFGPAPNPTLCPPPSVPPEIKSQYALSADTSSASLQAEINPRYWPDTTYFLEYGTSPCFEGGCASKPAPPGAILTSKTIKAQVKTAPILLEGLPPGTTFHYRFVAESSGGGPVLGLSGKSGAEAEGTFTTFAKPATESCPANEGFRGGVAAFLPDCRAYELVSPLDKSNADISVLAEGSTSQPATLDQSSTSGNKLAYGSATPFGDAPSGAFTSQYIASRGKTEWHSHGISPPHGRMIVEATGGFDTELKALSPDLCQSWTRTISEPPLAPNASPGFTNIYRRTDNECGGPAWEALTAVTPPTIGSQVSVQLELQGISADGETAIYLINDSLPGTESPPQPAECSGSEFGTGCLHRLYLQEPGEGAPHYVCILPDGTPLAEGCSAGTSGNDDGGFRRSNYQGAISADGSRVFWSSFAGSTPGLGPIYVRENPAQPQSALDGEGNCSEAELACTIAVSKEAEELSGTKGSRFWAGSADGSKAIFTTGSDLYEFDVESETTTLLAGEVPGLLGVSKDASYVYFASKEVLAGANPQGKAPTEGKVNLYRYHEGDFAFVGTLADVDVGVGRLPSPLWPIPMFHVGRVSSDGLHAAFMTQAAMTGYDNTDVKSGKADAEVFLYDASANGGGGKLLCASCNPTGARPAGRVRPLGAGSGIEFWTTAQIPAYENNLYAARVLSEDGNRLYFESSDALSLRDTNGVGDVYQWEEPGSGGCEKADPSYSALNEGCIELISSGKSARDAKFMDASPDGHDVFFTTLSSLLPHDYGLVDVYDARVGGGQPIPPGPPQGCEGDACQSPAPPPNDPTPASASFRGAGDPKAGGAKGRCAKGKRQVRRGGKARCVKKSAKRKRTGSKRGAAR